MELLKQWSEWLGFVEGQVTELCVGREVYKETREMYRRNPEIQKPSIFYSWMQGLFVTWSVTLIAGLVDDRKDTRSLVRLLRSIRRESHLLSREHMVSIYARNGFREEAAARTVDRTFDELVGSAERFLPGKQVEADIKNLLETAGPILSFRHERVAHFSANPSEQLPNYEHLDAAIHILVKLLQKYSLLIRGISADPFPTISYDWQAIFRVPWIVGDK